MKKFILLKSWKKSLDFVLTLWYNKDSKRDKELKKMLVIIFLSPVLQQLWQNDSFRIAVKMALVFSQN